MNILDRWVTLVVSPLYLKVDQLKTSWSYGLRTSIVHVITVLYLSECQHRTIQTLQLSRELEYPKKKKKNKFFFSKFNWKNDRFYFPSHLDTELRCIHTPCTEYVQYLGPLRCLIQVGLAWPVKKEQTVLIACPGPILLNKTPGASSSSHILNSLSHPFRCLLFQSFFVSSFSCCGNLA